MNNRIGVFVCECGPNIANNVDIERILKEISPMGDVVLLDQHRLFCSPPGKTHLKDQIEKEELTHVVMAACSPKQHEGTFMEVCESADLNPYLFQMANIREHCAWIVKDKEKATDKAIRHIKAAVRRVNFHSSLDKKAIECNGDVLVIGGGIAGITSSQTLASSERKVYLVEKEGCLGGLLNHFDGIHPNMESGREFIARAVEKVLQNENIVVMTESEVEHIHGFLGNFEVKVKGNAGGDGDDGGETEFIVGAVVMATGGELQVPEEELALINKFENVVTSLEFEKMNYEGELVLKNGKKPGSIAIIHCVGRKNAGYCSGICCKYSMKFSRYAREKVPEADISHFYSDLCISGKTEEAHYNETLEMGTRFTKCAEMKVVESEGKAMVEFKGQVGEKRLQEFDLVVILPAMVPGKDAPDIAEMANITMGDHGFFSQAHVKLKPVSTSIEGIYVAGCAEGPKNVEDSLVQALAVSGEIFSSLSIGKKLELEAKVSSIAEVLCMGCKKCLDVCSYSSIFFDDIKHVSVTNPIICRGCGNCVAACPSGAIILKGFTSKQLNEELMGGLI